jgi:Carboxypeptidase regulatory-like domain
MRRTFGIALLGLLTVSPLAPTAQAQFGKKKAEPQMRSVSGQVLTTDGTPAKNAVVYLKNANTLSIKTIIAQDGSYNFMDLSPNADYQVWAEYNGVKSQVKTVSSFDSRPQFRFDLKLQPAK